MGVRFKVKSDRRAVLNTFERLRTALRDLRPALDSAAKELTRRVYYRFQTKRDPDGKRWAPWSPATRAKHKNNPRARLMLVSRSLRDNSRFVAGKKDIFAFVGEPYGVYHEQGNPERAKRGKLPRRAFMFSIRGGRRTLAEADEEMVLNKLRYQLRKALK